MRQIKVRPILVEVKGNEDRTYLCILKHSHLFDDDKGKIGYYDCNIRTPTVEMELVLVSLDPADKILEGDLFVNEQIEGGIALWKHNGEIQPNSNPRKVIATQDQLPLEYIHQFIGEYNKGEVEDIEIEMKEVARMNLLGKRKPNRFEPKLINGFVTIVKPCKENSLDDMIDETELIIRRFVNHAKIHGFPSKSFKKKVKRYLASARDNASKKMYTEEEVRNLFIKRCKNFSTQHEKFSQLLLEQDLKWFEENKK